MASNQYLSRLGFILALDSSEFLADIEKAQREWKDFSNEAKRDSAAAAKAIVELEVATKNYGKTLTAVDRMKTEIETGKYAQAQEWEKNLLLQKAAAYDKVTQAATKANAAQNPGGLSNFQRQAIMYQTTDTITSLMGGQNPLMVLMQQGGQLKDQFGGLGPMFRGLAAAITPVGVAVTAVTTSVLGLGYAMYKGYEESKAFNSAIMLTGNYAGLTADRFGELASVISSKYNTSIGGTKEAMQMLVATGNFAGSALTSVSQLIASFSRVSGESAVSVAEKLIPSLDGTANSAQRLNSQYHFLTLEQYKHIEALEKQGKLQESITYTSDLFNEKLSKQTMNLGYLEQAWKTVTNKASEYWDAIKGIGRDETMSDKLRKAATNVEAFTKAWGSKDIRSIQALQEYNRLAEQLFEETKSAEDKSKAAQKEQERIDQEKKLASKLRTLQQQIDDTNAQTKYEREAANLDRIRQLELTKVREITIAANEMRRSIEQDGAGVRTKEIEKFLAKEEQIISRAERQKADIYRDELKKYTDKAQAELDLINQEKEKIAFYKENLLLSEADLDIALSRLKTEQEIAKIRNNKLLSDKDKTLQENSLRYNQIQREAVINQATDLKMLQDMNRAVFSNMSNALENFVRTGKFSFRDLALSIYRDLTMIEMKAQATSIWRSIGGLSGIGQMLGLSGSVGGTRGPDNIDVGGGWSPRASGGSVLGGSTYLVGENGPELFTSNTSGTISPNDKMGSALGGTTNVTNNYINAIDTKSFEDRLLGSSKTIWAANKYGEKNLSLGTGRT
jgi:phage-related minor tail protein